MRKLGRQGFQRSWERLRLETEQGKQLALNRERIASLYSCEGYRLDLSGAHLGFVTLFLLAEPAAKAAAIARRDPAGQSL